MSHPDLYERINRKLAEAGVSLRLAVPSDPAEMERDLQVLYEAALRLENRGDRRLNLVGHELMALHGEARRASLADRQAAVTAEAFLPAAPVPSVRRTDDGQSEQTLPTRPAPELAVPNITALNATDDAEMVWIPPGEYLMGCNREEIEAQWRSYGWPDEWKRWATAESPAHRVTLDGFWLYRCDVTVAQYRRYCRATRCGMPESPEWGWKDDHPIVNVSWKDALEYCRWSGCRLPTEVEWEYAARGGMTGLEGRPHHSFVWGDQLPSGSEKYGNLPDEELRERIPGAIIFTGYVDGYGHMTSPVGAFRPNGFGLYDMAGNVWQWCSDWYDPEIYARSSEHNPQGPTDGTARVLRGGSWYNPPSFARVSSRLKNLPESRDHVVGFRPAKSR